MPATYEPIATVTVSGSTVQDISFTSIPSTYTDLILVGQLRSQRSGFATSEVYGYINYDSANNYSRTRIWTTTSSVSSDRNSNQGFFLFGEVPAANATAGIFGTVICHFNNYANTNVNKTILSRSGAAISDALGNLYANLWRSTSAISVLNIYNTSAAYWSVGSTLTLYGIKAA
jgi:hypothetical protein